MRKKSLKTGGHPKRGRNAGFTLIETLVVVAIIGSLMMSMTPGILNSLETRRLDNAARDITTTLQRAKYAAVKTRLNHRVTFALVDSIWEYYIEQEGTAGSWSIIPGSVKKYISERLEVAIKEGEADKTIEFNPLGYQTNFATGSNTIELRSNKLYAYGQPDERIISFYFGGAIKYTSQTRSGG